MGSRLRQGTANVLKHARFSPLSHESSVNKSRGYEPDESGKRTGEKERAVWQGTMGLGQSKTRVQPKKKKKK